MCLLALHDIKISTKENIFSFNLRFFSKIVHNIIFFVNVFSDHKLVTNQIKETHESLLMARRCYKNFLNFYYTIESRAKDQQVIFVQFFTESKRDSEKNSIRLLRNTQTGKYSCKTDMFLYFKLKSILNIASSCL